MSHRRFVVGLAGAIAAWMIGAANAGATQAVPTAQDTALERRVARISDTLRCLVCQNQTIADSNAPLAQDLRARVRQMLREGASEQEVVAFMVERYGDFVLYRPPLHARTALLWFGPALMFVAGIVVVVFTVWRRRGSVEESPVQAQERAIAAGLLDARGDGAAR